MTSLANIHYNKEEADFNETHNFPGTRNAPATSLQAENTEKKWKTFSSANCLLAESSRISSLEEILLLYSKFLWVCAFE